MERKKVLMVCLGNICRSPLAEGILKDNFRKKNIDAFVDSAGTAAYHAGESPDIRSVDIARKYNIDITDQLARKFTVEDFDLFDKIFVMDNSNYNDVIGLARNKMDIDKVDLIMNQSDPGKNISVPDPYYDEKEGFQNVYKMLDKACKAIVENIENKLL
ncbi:MAG: low molecular weight protein-tyrosine-phosphatase [Bacteroidota bacterium]